VAVRVVLAVLALAAGAWLVVQERAARAEQALIMLAFESREPPPVAESERLLARARRLNPDRRPDLFEGVILARQGRPDAAIAVIRGVTRAEPENLEAWALLVSAAERVDPALARAARARARELAPAVR
jgi:predicted Zn-dependent protease